MKHYLAALLIATLSTTAVPGAAQRSDHAGTGNKNSGGGGQQNGGGRANRAEQPTQARPDRPMSDKRASDARRSNQRPDMRRPNMGRPNSSRPEQAPDRPAMHNPRPTPVIIRPQYPTGNAGRPARPDYSYNRPPPGNYWRPDTGRPQANWWQNGRWNQRPVYAPVYRYPQGYGYRRWSPGLILPSLFFGSTYFFDQFVDIGLSPPPYGYRWVRYGPDLLLINTRSGRIRDVRYSVFG